MSTKNEKTKQNANIKQNETKIDIEKQLNDFLKHNSLQNEIDIEILRFVESQMRFEFAIQRKTIHKHLKNTIESYKNAITRTQNSKLYYALLRLCNNKKIVILRDNTKHTYVMTREKYDKLNDTQKNALKQKYEIVM